MDRTVERLVCTTVGDCAWRLFFLVFTTVADDGVGTCGSCLNHCLGLWMLPFLVFTTMADDGVGTCGSSLFRTVDAPLSCVYHCGSGYDLCVAYLWPFSS